MNNLLESLKQQFASFEKDATAHVLNGNKAAGLRARNVSLAIEKSLKVFRKQSNETSKQKASIQ